MYRLGNNTNDVNGRKAHLDFLKEALEIATRLNAEALFFWSGVKHDHVADRNAWKWLIAGCRELSAYAEKYSLNRENSGGGMHPDIPVYDRCWILDH